MGSVVELVIPSEQGSLSLPVYELVATLEEFLAQARSGHLRAMAFVSVSDQGEVMSGTKSAMDEAHRLTILGGLTILTQRLANL